MREGHTKARHLTFECFPGGPLNHVYRGVNQMAASLLGQLRRFEALLVTTLMPTLSSATFFIRLNMLYSFLWYALSKSKE